MLCTSIIIRDLGPFGIIDLSKSSRFTSATWSCTGRRRAAPGCRRASRGWGSAPPTAWSTCPCWTCPGAGPSPTPPTPPPPRSAPAGSRAARPHWPERWRTRARGPAEAPCRSLWSSPGEPPWRAPVSRSSCASHLSLRPSLAYAPTSSASAASGRSPPAHPPRS